MAAAEPPTELTPELRKVIACALMAAGAPPRKTGGGRARIPWYIIADLREACDAAGLDWLSIHHGLRNEAAKEKAKVRDHYIRASEGGAP